MTEIPTPYSLPKDDILRRLEVSETRGLSSEEALRRLGRYGKNRLETSSSP